MYSSQEHQKLTHSGTRRRGEKHILPVGCRGVLPASMR